MIGLMVASRVLLIFLAFVALGSHDFASAVVVVDRKAKAHTVVANRSLHSISQPYPKGHLNNGLAPDGGASAQQPQRPSLMSVIINVLIQCFAATAFAYLYKKYKPKPETDALLKKEDLDKKYHDSIFDCFSDMKICLVGFCCPCTLWADSTSMVGILSFWVAFALILGSTACSQIIPFAWLIFILAAVFYRNEFRKKFQMHHDTFGTFAEDCLCGCFCFQCMLCQDARHVKAAAQAGHSAIVGEAVNASNEV